MNQYHEMFSCQVLLFEPIPLESDENMYTIRVLVSSMTKKLHIVNHDNKMIRGRKRPPSSDLDLISMKNLFALYNYFKLCQ